jgi:hypothetical protein
LVACVIGDVRGFLVACVVFPSIQMTTSTMTLKVSRHLILSEVVVCRPWPLFFFFFPFALLLSKFALTIQNFRVILSFTDISTLIFIFFYFGSWFFHQILIYLQFDHWIHNYDLFFFFSNLILILLILVFWLVPRVNLSFLFSFPLQFKILSWSG